MTDGLGARLQQRLRDREAEGLLRRLRAGYGDVDFCSNDYLGLSRDADVIAAIESANTGLDASGSTGSRLISGNSERFESLEAEIAAFHRAQAALTFSTGYAANTGLFSCVLGSGDTIITDRLVHASILDGVQLGKARHVRFRHNDLEHLEHRLSAATGSIVIGVESVYSMDGDRAPLPEIVQLAEQYDAEVIVDEAHSVGIDGPGGAGSVVEAGLQDRVFARICTFGKALGTHGAAVVGSAVLRDYLVNFARPFIYSTAPSPHAVESTRAVYKLLPALDAQREQLRNRIRFFRECVGRSRLKWLESTSPIQSVIIPGNEAVRRTAAALQEAGFAVVPIVSPTVPVGSERIRITLHSDNTESEIAALFDAIETEQSS